MVNSDGKAGLVVQDAKQTLDENLLTLQLANEPDLYALHLKKQTNYSEADPLWRCSNEDDDPKSSLSANPRLLGPVSAAFHSVASHLTSLFSLPSPTIETDRYLNFKDLLASMNYPNSNCATGAGAVVPRVHFPNSLNYHNAQLTVVTYAGQISFADGQAEDDGNEYGVLRWTVKLLRYLGFSGRRPLEGGLWSPNRLSRFTAKSFTPPPTNVTKYRQWTTGAVFYASIVVAETLSKSGASQVIDLQLDDNDEERAGDPRTGTDYTAQAAICGQETGLPRKISTFVMVKYLGADSVSINCPPSAEFNDRADQTNAHRTAAYTTKPKSKASKATHDDSIDILVPSLSVVFVFPTDGAFTRSGDTSGDAPGSTPTFATTETTFPRRKDVGKKEGNLRALQTTAPLSQQQIRLVRATSTLISPHGARAANAVLEQDSSPHADTPASSLDNATTAGMMASVYRGDESEESYEDPDENSNEESDEENADDEDDGDDPLASNTQNDAEPARPSVCSPSASAVASGVITAQMTPDEQKDRIWSIHEDHRTVNLLCGTVTEYLEVQQSSSSARSSFSMEYSDREYERFSRIRHKFERNDRVEDEEILEVMDLFDKISVSDLTVERVAQEDVDTGEKSFKNFGQAEFRMIHKRFSISIE
ncbi:hypothetical protein FRC01_005547 [Tulasnella sp. 417]|nr:hypothetical protein FRC01_005547 [Tulasnella sp. 417]